MIGVKKIAHATYETPDLDKQIEANLVFLRHALDQYQQLQAVGQDL